MVGSKLGLRMTTLHEETLNTGNQLSPPTQDEDEEKSEVDYCDYETYQVQLKMCFFCFTQIKKVNLLIEIFSFYIILDET